MKNYRTSERPKVAKGAAFAERGKRSREDVKALHDRIHADKVHKSRSNGQRVRQARERQYGKNSHLVVTSRIEGWVPPTAEERRASALRMAKLTALGIDRDAE